MKFPTTIFVRTLDSVAIGRQTHKPIRSQDHFYPAVERAQNRFYNAVARGDLFQERYAREELQLLYTRRNEI